MELFDTTQIGLERALSGASLRQQAIAQNLANVNTPGYRRQDVDFTSALHAAWEQGSQKVESVDATVQVDQSAVMRADGSSVDIDTEAAAQSKNGLQYEAVSAVIKTRTAILRSAIGLG
jgi:flagellar basal-body rod protein FlgB